jgi:hypothetical protein
MQLAVLSFCIYNEWNLRKVEFVGADHGRLWRNICFTMSGYKTRHGIILQAHLCVLCCPDDVLLHPCAKDSRLC